MPRKKRLTRELIGETALALADEQGLDGLTMRALAARLGVGTMTLYSYVADREALEGLTFDHLIRTEVSDPYPTQGPWKVRVRQALGVLRAVLHQHPALAPMLLNRSVRSRAALQIIESLLAALRDGGFQGAALITVYHTILGYTTGFILTDLSGPFAAARGRTLNDVANDIAELDAEAFPNLVDIAKLAKSNTDATSEANFRIGLEALLEGLSASLRRAAEQQG